jgi:ribosomal protein L37AE/L43A
MAHNPKGGFKLRYHEFALLRQNLFEISATTTAEFVGECRWKSVRRTTIWSCEHFSKNQANAALESGLFARDNSSPKSSPEGG